MSDNFTCATRSDCDCSAGLSAEFSDCQGTPGPAGEPGEPGLPGVQTYFGSGDPNGFVEGNQGDFYKDSDSGSATYGQLWTKTTQSGTTGWA
jgi:hypothetical protein